MNQQCQQANIAQASRVTLDFTAIAYGWNLNLAVRVRSGKVACFALLALAAGLAYASFIPQAQI